MRTFVLNRKRDDTGVSGTGVVAEGVVFTSGKCIISWLTDSPSLNIYNSVYDMLHIHGHEGATSIEFKT